ncbi:unnamed protein product [Cuscuta campestris]|uniref:Uncharacterized protein n=1 Tax=Cuscuta campestris TaxID=132261 RepID=A0A484MRP7_9ASTE|nr:unnamed protein product [Cuscuta campestris]
MTPRSGTAVKLLGRDDASVDWYNLEKSRRVKAFRCGEFDECIERAEASLGMPPKKREKYARREDAIMHALVLERQLVGGKNGTRNYSCDDMINKSPDDTVSRVLTSPECFGNKNQGNLSVKSHKALVGSVSPHKDEIGVCGDVGRKGNQLSGDNNYSILPPRKRGLMEFGLSAPPPKHKTSLVVSSGINKLFSERIDRLEGCPNKVGIVSSETLQVSKNSDELSVSYLHPDRSSSGFTSVPREEQLGVMYHAKKRRHGFHADDFRGCSNASKVYLPTTRTNISTLKLEGSYCPCQDESCEEKTSGSTECTETDSSETDCEESDSDDDIATISEGAASIELQPKYLGRSQPLVKHGGTSSEDSDDLSGADSHPCINHSVSACVGVSKWLLKGKRNNRGFAKKPPDTCVEKNRFKRPGYVITSPATDNKNHGASSFMKSPRVNISGYPSRGGGSCGNSANWGDLSKGDWVNCGGEYLDHPSYNNIYHHLGVPRSLIEVDLKVQAGYKRQPMPLISVTSKKTGHVIVGHPVKIEVLDNGFVECLFAEADDAAIYRKTLDDESSFQPTWRTARRKAGARVPCHHPSSSSMKRNRNARKATSTGFHHKATSISLMMKKNSTTQQLPPSDKALPKKALRNITSPSTHHQKIRTLSSIASQQKQCIDANCNRFHVDGLIKQGSMLTVACIPVKLVFSRLNEDLAGGLHP